MKEALSMHPDAEVIFFLGDGLAEVDVLSRDEPHRFWIAVRGNCDFYSSFQSGVAKKCERICLEGYNIVATHGDLYGVKYSDEGLLRLAEESCADIVLFGHTHRPYEKYISSTKKPVYLFNPGSISVSSGSYGVMMLDKVPFFSHGEII
jgi:putative phosphoesterase